MSEAQVPYTTELTADVMEAAKNQFLARVVEHTSNNYALLEMTEDDVAKVTLNLMVNSFMNSFGGNVEESTAKMEAFVCGTLRKMRHNEATKLILPASARVN